jgi:hypothetical protein
MLCILITSNEDVGNSAKHFVTQTVITAGANVLKEFWPDIRKNVFRMKDGSHP